MRDNACTAMRDRRAKIGQGPGSLIHVGKPRDVAPRISVLDYTPTSFSEKGLSDPAELQPFCSDQSISWINVDGIHDSKIVERIGELFGVHILLLEDIMNSTTRPKVEFAGEYMFIVLKVIEPQPESSKIEPEHFCLIVGSHFLITFQERPGDSFDGIRERIRTSRGMVRTRNAHYLAYLLLDVVIDNYIAASDRYAEVMDELETAVLRSPSEATLHRILAIRKDLLSFKRSIDPVKEVISSIQKEVDPNTSKYFRDLQDHILSESENLAVYREMLVNLLDLHHSSLSYRTNAVMKMLTIITTIFVPLTFIVGVYGMNFDHMPELRWRYGYFAVLGLMLSLVLGMLLYFRRKKWL